MSAPRIVPSEQAKSVATWTLVSDGVQVPGTVRVMSIVTQHELGRIPSATLLIHDGEPSRETFAVSDGELFEPGAEVEVQLGYRSSEETVFRGVVVRQTVKVRRGGSVLQVLLRDAVDRMTLDRRSRYFQDATDADVIEALLSDHGIEKDVASTETVHTTMVQHDATDWDMLLCRAEVAGLLVAVTDGKVRAFRPDANAESALKLQYGATVHELDSELDARLQAKRVVATPWVPADQALAEPIEASEPSVPDAGNSSADDLASVMASDAWTLRHGADLKDSEVQAWVDAKLLRHRYGRIRGRVTTDGTSVAGVGDLLELHGVGERFSGKLLISGVRQQVERGAWKTTLQFGLDPRWFIDRFEATGRPAGGLLPAIAGLHTGVVVALEGDPEQEERIRVRIPTVHGEDDGAWCRLATLDAGEDRGTWFRPEIDDEVVVGFVADDPRHGIVLGQLHSSAKPSPEPGTDDNHLKGYQSRSGMRVSFDDDGKVVTLETPKGNRLTLSEADEMVAIYDQHGNEVVLDEKGVTISAKGNLELSATGDLKLEAKGSLSAEGATSARLAGGGGCELSLGPSADLSGPTVNIN